ncbi:MAG: hypothetical protein HYY65_14430 [Candidatus Tectomicrobia bacterium]|uniref:Uncharacterized protein n=1 Tax=Tectimicrobiota bacterium TaxID=2528274 RepID=A0A932M1V3_UNCTE|nr:hypothetical protein [Candidatus Tectomicrobia bacterium]
MLRTIHVHLGWTLLGIAVLMVVLSLSALWSRWFREKGRSRIALFYMILVDLQVLLGISNYVGMRSGSRPNLLHPITMLAAAAVIHVARKVAAAPGTRLAGARRTPWVLYLVAALLILLGIGWAQMLPRG